MIEDVKKNAALGRKLWIGLFLPAYPKIHHPITSLLPEDAHLTLLFLGRDRTPEDVEHVAEAVAQVWRLDSRPLSLEITGVGWFWRRQAPTVVALVNSARLFAMRATMMNLLAERGVRPDDYFGFVPHVTLKGNDANALAYAHSFGPAVKVEVPMITIVCGEAQENVR